MSMLAMPESECQEILALFRLHLPHVPDAWLQELAANYGRDAVVDIDPNDVIAILSVPGEFYRIEIPLAEHVPPVEVHRQMNAELLARGIEPRKIVASLLTIHDSSAKLSEVGKVVRSTEECCANAAIKGWAHYAQTSCSGCVKIIWAVICFTSLDGRQDGSQS